MSSTANHLFELRKLAVRRSECGHRAYSRAALWIGYLNQGACEGAEIIDESGDRHLDIFDAFGNQSFGYRHPEIYKALMHQLQTGYTNSCKVFFESSVIEFSENLAKLTNGELPYSYLTNGGAEAIDGAIKLARASTGRSKIISIEGCYHGKTYGALSTAGKDQYAELYGPLVPDFHTVAFNSVEAFENAIDGNTAAVIVEPIQGEGGIRMADASVIQRLRELCSDRGAALIFDEIQSAFGRTGKFFCYQHYGVVPDIICIGKSFGGGMLPIAAFLARKQFWKPFEVAPVSFGSSLGGNPLAVAVGSKTIEIAQRASFLESVQEKEQKVAIAFEKFSRDYSSIIDHCSGKGLMWGIHFHSEAVAGLFIWRLRQQNLITSFSLYDPRVVRFQPPLVINNEQLQRAIQGMSSELYNVASYLQNKDISILESKIVLKRIFLVDEDTVFSVLSNKVALSLLMDSALDVHIGGDNQIHYKSILDGTPLVWSEEVDFDARTKTIRQQAVNGDWEKFSRHWEIKRVSGKTKQTELVLSIEWNLGTVQFEQTLALRVAWSLDKEFNNVLDKLEQKLESISAPVPASA